MAKGSGYDTEESSSESSSDEQPEIKKKKSHYNPKKTEQKDPFKVMEELRELLSSKSSSEPTTVDLSTIKNSKTALDSF